MLLRDLCGQDRAAAVLKRALASRHVPHAYLFEGPAGVGKRRTAIALALALACPQEPGQGCGTCDICTRILAGHHPDVRVVVAEGEQIVKKQMDDIVALACTRPHEAPVRVMVLDEAHRLNKEAANGLLKTLEEPAPGNHLVLVTSAPDRLLPTIRSRTQRVRFIPVHSEAGQDESWQTITRLREAAAQNDMGSIFSAAAGEADKEKKETLPGTLALLARFYRDAVASSVGAADLVSLQQRSDDIARATSPDPRVLVRLRRAWAAVPHAETALASNLNATAVLERLLIAMRPCERDRGP